MTFRDAAQAAGLRVGWVAGPRIPRRAVGLLAQAVASAGVWAGLVDTAGWRANAAVVLGRQASVGQTRAAVANYARYFVEMLSLPGWSPGEVAAAVRIRPQDFADLRRDLTAPGAVLALGHLANWDLAGAWAAGHGLPVTSVAEELPGSAYADFLRYREGLGFQIYGNRSPGLVSRLVEDARQHRMVCLLADRDLSGRGVPVRWPAGVGKIPVTVPVGPALVAQRSGAVLRALALRYDGDTMVMDFSGPIRVEKGPEAVAAAMQHVTDHLAAAVRRDVTQWHVLQPRFAAAGISGP